MRIEHTDDTEYGTHPKSRHGRHRHPHHGRHHDLQAQNPSRGEDRSLADHRASWREHSAIEGVLEAIHAVGRRGYGHGSRGEGRSGGRHGMGGGDENGLRAGRMLAQSDLRLVALSLISQAPRHGYELIKLIEEMTQGWYTPSPGVIYPMLTYLEEAGFVTVVADGNKRLFSITEAGTGYLLENRVLAEAVVARLKAVGERAKYTDQPEAPRGRDRRQHNEDRDLPRSVEAAVLNLREVIARKLRQNDEAAPDVVNALLELAFRWSKE